MKQPNPPLKESTVPETYGLRMLRISTLVMTIIMILGFIVIVSLLSIAINKNIKLKDTIITDPKFVLFENEILNSISYLPNYTILVLTKDKDTQIIRFLSNETGKVLSNVLVSDIMSKESSD